MGAILSAAPTVAPNTLGWQPSDNGWLVSNGSLPAYTTSATAVAAATLLLMKVMIRQSITATNIVMVPNANGTGASTHSFVGLYNSAGTLLQQSADISTIVAAAAGTGAAVMPLAATVPLTAGTFVWVGIQSNYASTQPTFWRAGGAGSVFVLSAGLTAATAAAASAGAASGATMPSSFTPSSNTISGGIPYFAAIS